MDATQNGTEQTEAPAEPCGPCADKQRAAAMGSRWADLSLGLLAVGFGLLIVIMGADLMTGGRLAAAVGLPVDGGADA